MIIATMNASSPTDESAVRVEQLQLAARQAVRTPAGVILLCAFIVYLMWQHQPHELLLGWTALTALLLIARAAFSRRLLQQTPQRMRTRQATAYMCAFTFAIGLVGGSAGLLFFAGAPLAEQALLTMVLCCWCAGAIGTTSSLPRLFYVFAVPFLAPIILSWSFASAEQGPWIALLITLFGAYQMLFVRDNGRKVVEGLRIRHERAGLIEALEREREEAQQARERAELASQAKTRFLAAASHDLRQPLHALSLYADALTEKATQPEVQKLAHRIGTAIESLDGLLEALLDISRLDAGVIVPQPRRVALRGLLERLAAEFQPQADAKGVALRLEAQEAALLTDALLLERILRNLLDNAVRYTASGRIELGARRVGDGLRISVSDTGVGIAPAEQARVFEEFYQANNSGRDVRKGLGLGLATVKRLAELLDFRITLESTPGKGSAFTIEVPAAALMRDAGPSAPQPAPRPAARDLSGLRVLVIDDDPRAQDAMREILETWGCRPALAASASEAVAAALRDRPDLIVADYRLAREERGTDAVRAVTTLAGAIPALLVTGDTAPQRIREAQASGLPLLHKPVKAAALREELEQLVLGARAAAQ